MWTDNYALESSVANKRLPQEMALRNITVNAIAPG